MHNNQKFGRMCAYSLSAIAAAFGGSALAVAQSETNYRFQYGFDSTTQFVSWKTKGTGQKGYQLYVPSQTTMKALSGDIEFDLGLKTAFIQSRSMMIGYGGGVTTQSDTVLQLQTMYKGWGALQPFVTLALNMPTGKATLKNTEHRAVMDKDLVYQTRFGEGWNWNPGIGFAYSFSKELTATMGIGYNFRGGYIPDGDSQVRYLPGNQVITTTSLSWQSGPYAAGINGTATFEEASFQDGEKNFKPGNSYAGSMYGSYMWTERHSTTISGSYTYTEKNKTLDYFTSTYARETQNSNSSVYTASLQQNFQITAPWSIFTRASYLNRDKNLYDPISNYYVSAKRKLTGEIGTAYTVAQNFQINASLGQFHLKQASTPYAYSVKSRGVVGSLGIKVGF